MCEAHKHLESNVWASLTQTSITPIREDIAPRIADTNINIIAIIENQDFQQKNWTKQTITIQSITRKKSWDSQVLTHARNALKNMDQDLGMPVFDVLRKCKDTEDIDKIYWQIMSGSFKNSQNKYAELIEAVENDPKQVDEVVLGSDTISHITVVNAQIENCKKELEVAKTYTTKWGVQKVIDFFRGNKKRAQAKIQFEVGWAIKEMKALQEKKWDLDRIVQGLHGIEEKITTQHMKDYQVYVALNYMIIIIGEEIKRIQQEIKNWNLDEMWKVKREEKINELNARIETLMNQAEYMQQYAVLEFLNAKNAKITANKVQQDYDMMQFLLARKIENYFRSAELTKWVNLGLALKDANLNLMQQSLLEARQLLESQMQIQQGWAQWLDQLDREMKKHEATLNKTKSEGEKLKAKQFKTLESLKWTTKKLLILSEQSTLSLPWVWENEQNEIPKKITSQEKREEGKAKTTKRKTWKKNTSSKRKTWKKNTSSKG